MIRNRIDWIDSFKGIAIIGVVFIHSGAANLPGLLGRIGGAGAFGVQVFFLISAMLTWYSMDKKYPGYFKWIKSKMIRLMPEYYIAFIAALFISQDKHSPVDVLLHVSGLWGLSPVYSNTLIAEWYLGALILFYLIAPLLHRIFNSLGRALFFFCISLFFSCVFRELAHFLFPTIKENYSINAYINNTSIYAQLPCLALGVVLYYISTYLNSAFEFNKNSNEKRSIIAMAGERVLISYSLTILAIFYLGGIILQKSVLWGLSTYVMVAFGFVILAVSQLFVKIPLINNGFFSFIGKHTYSIYLFHYILIRVYNRFIQADNAFNCFLKMFVSIFLSILISVLFKIIRVLLTRGGQSS